MSFQIFIVYVLLGVLPLSLFGQHPFSIVEKPDKKKIDILYHQKLLTSYCYFDSTEKPVLFPLRTLSGVTVTRGWPVSPREGERTDHPHHVGLWFTYENVNGLDFWNNSFAIPLERKKHYGSIRHQKVLSAKAANGIAQLATLSHWVDWTDKVLLTEETEFTFSVRGNDFIIDRVATLRAQGEKVLFTDVKDGLLGLRVARQLELPSTQQDKFVDSHGKETLVPVLNNEGVTGKYVNREGVRDDSVWSSQSVWTCLTGKKDGEIISIVIIDHQKNIGYPTYWHARGYGLFAANPLGRKIFSGGKDELQLKLDPSGHATFRYRIIIHHGDELSSEKIEQFRNEFAWIY